MAQKNKLYQVTKYILAKSAKDAIEKEKSRAVDDVWIDSKWREAQGNTKSAIGFMASNEEDED
jgi:hypothetical protein